MRSSLSIFLLLSCLRAICQSTSDFTVPRSNLHLKLPNDKWKFFPGSDTAGGVYIFKREAITDAQNRSIIPAIMVFVEDAHRFNDDIILFSTDKQITFQEKGVNMGEMQVLDHILYMIYFIDRKHHAVQLYLDMTKDLGQQYEDELLSTIRSVKEM